MRVLLVAQGLFPFAGGTAFSEASLCSSVGRHCETTVICRQGEIDYSFARGYGLRDVKEYHPHEAYDAFRNKKHRLRKLFEGVDLVHFNGHWRWEDHFLARLCVEMKIPYVLQPRGMLLVGHRSYWRKRAYNFLLGNYIVKHAAKIIALSRFEIRQFAPYDIDPKNILVLPNGITPVEIPDQKEVSPHFKKMSGEEYFLYYGRIEARKNLLFLADAYLEYVKRGGRCRLYFMGPSERGYDEKLKVKLRRLELEDYAEVLSASYQTERWHLVAHARAVVYPTLEEPFGRVPFEALSAGTFPIVPNESGSAEYLSSLLPRSIYTHQNVESLVEAMRNHESPPGPKAKKELEKARKWVHSELDWDRLIKTLVKTYKEILPEPVHKPRRRKIALQS